MLLDPVIVSFCLSFSSYSPTSNTGCQQALNALSVQEQVTSTMDLLESYEQKQLHKNINENVILGTIVAGTLVNTINNKQLVAQIPIQQYNLELDGTLGLINKSYGLHWHREF